MFAMIKKFFFLVFKTIFIFLCAIVGAIVGFIFAIV